MLILGTPVNFIDFSLSICFISKRTKSVYDNNSSILGVILKTPDVSKAVFILCFFKVLKRLIIKSA